jgi:hypothetical protein
VVNCSHKRKVQARIRLLLHAGTMKQSIMANIPRDSD